MSLFFVTVIDLIESGDITDGWVKFDVRLVSRFRDSRSGATRRGPPTCRQRRETFIRAHETCAKHSHSIPTSPSRVKSADRAGPALPTLERQRNQPDIPMPFHALGGDKDKVWERFTTDGQPSLAGATTTPFDC